MTADHHADQPADARDSAPAELRHGEVHAVIRADPDDLLGTVPAIIDAIRRTLNRIPVTGTTPRVSSNRGGVESTSMRDHDGNRVDHRRSDPDPYGRHLLVIDHVVARHRTLILLRTAVGAAGIPSADDPPGAATALLDTVSAMIRQALGPHRPQAESIRNMMLAAPVLVHPPLPPGRLAVVAASLCGPGLVVDDQGRTTPADLPRAYQAEATASGPDGRVDRMLTVVLTPLLVRTANPAPDPAAVLAGIAAGDRRDARRDQTDAPRDEAGNRDGRT